MKSALRKGGIICTQVQSEVNRFIIGRVSMAAFAADKTRDEQCGHFVFVSAVCLHDHSDLSLWTNRVYFGCEGVW